MQKWKDILVNNLREMINNVVKDCKGDGNLKCRVCFIGYREVQPITSQTLIRFELLPFTKNIDDAVKYISDVKLIGGGNNCDPIHDIDGALKLSLYQDWTEEAVKRVVLLTNGVPPHANKY